MNHQESLIELSSRAFNLNIATYKKIIGNRQFGLVVKCNAYGHGLLEIAKLAQSNKQVDWLCIARLQEALLLRTNNITKPLLLLSPLYKNYEQAIRYDVDLMVHDTICLEQIDKAAQKVGKIARVHIKIDTGLSRFGFYVEEAVSFFEKMHTYPCVQVVGIYTHFADADNLDPSYTLLQQERFYSLIKKLYEKNIIIEHIHCANSAFASTGDLGPTNLVRVGAGAYGMWPSDAIKKITQSIEPKFNLQQMFSWKTIIVRIKKIDPHTPIGYSKTAITKKLTRIGILPVGYFDGYDRRLSNKGCVYINGQKAPVIGMIGMNLTAIDITGIKNVSVGNEVEIVGNKPGITFHDIAKKIKSYNPREVSSKIHSEIGRVVIPCETQTLLNKRKKQDHVYY